jgi:CheY-like chemotaxis protein
MRQLYRPPVQDPAPPSRRPRILVVDDDLTIRQVNARVLIHSGYEVDIAKDGEEAWGALKGARYDLLITDHDMPWVTGLELIQKLRSAAMSLPVILASGTVPTEELHRLPGLAIQAVLHKPCPLEQFLQTVREVLAAIETTRAGAAPSSDRRGG